MPVAFENKLKREAATKGYGEKRTGSYVYGTIRKTGWTPSSQKKLAPKKLGDHYP